MSIPLMKQPWSSIEHYNIYQCCDDTSHFALGFLSSTYFLTKCIYDTKWHLILLDIRNIILNIMLDSVSFRPRTRASKVTTCTIYTKPKLSLIWLELNVNQNKGLMWIIIHLSYFPRSLGIFPNKCCLLKPSPTRIHKSSSSAVSSDSNQTSQALHKVLRGCCHD